MKTKTRSDASDLQGVHMSDPRIKGIDVPDDYYIEVHADGTLTGRLLNPYNERDGYISVSWDATPDEDDEPYGLRGNSDGPGIYDTTHDTDAFAKRLLAEAMGE